MSLDLLKEKLQGVFKTLRGYGKLSERNVAAGFKKQKQHVVLVAGDLARPAAIEQLQILGKQIGVTVLTFPGETSPENVAKLAREEVTRLRAEGAIFAPAGRLDVDDSLLAELESVGKAWEPQESLLVADAATGQTAV